jgi:integrase
MVIQGSDVDYAVSFAYNRYTVASYRSALTPLVGMEFTRESVQRYVNGWHSLARSTIAVRKSALNKLVLAMSAIGKCDRGVLDGVIYPEGRPPQMRGKIENDDLRKLFGSVATTEERLLLTVLLDTGLRIGSLVELRFKDLLSESFRMRVKMGKTIEIYPTDSCSMLAARLAEEGDMEQDDYVFQAKVGGKGYTRLLSRVLEKIADRAGVKVTAHQFRHTFITNISERHDIVIAQELAGHSNISTTRRYVHPARERLMVAARTSGLSSTFGG